MHRDPDETQDLTQDPTRAPLGDATDEPANPSSSSTPGSTRPPQGGPQTTARFTPGDLIADRYRVVGFLGKGGMGEVYRADDLELAQSVAIKILPSRIAADPTLADRVRAEVRLARGITHRNVCRIHDIARLPDDRGGDMFITMEYVDGEDLASLLRRIGKLPQDKAIEVARQLCAALAAAHDQGVIHRDLKPANVMLDGRGNARLTDFGIAAIDDQLDQHDASSGTPAYMSPEQFNGEGVSKKSDIYALGLVIYELLTGRPAWTANSVAELRTLRESTGSPVTLTSATQADIDPALAALVERCTESDPRNRPASALAVAAALPGADPLAAALAAGETPSPELIAASGGKGVVAPRTAALCLAANAILIAAAIILSHGTTLLSVIPPPPAPALMQEAAINIIEQLGHRTTAESGTPLPRRTGWTINNFAIAETSAAINEGTLNDWAGLGKSFSPPIRYWLRIEPNRFQPINPSGQVTPDDPPRTSPHSTLIEIDTNRRLKGFQRQAPLRTSTPADAEPDWDEAFQLAGLDIDNFEPISDRRQSGSDAELRRAWTGSYPPDESGLEPAGINVFAGAFAGKVTEFAIVGNEPVPDIETPQIEDSAEPEGAETDSTQARLAGPNTPQNPVPPTDPTAKAVASSTDATTKDRIASTASLIQSIAQWLVLTTITLVAGILAYRNIRRKRSDIRRAARVGVTVFVLTTITAILSVDSFARGMGLVFGPFPLYAVGLGFTAITLVCYIAVEPLARSRWPNSLVSWTRLFSGGFRDPMIGRDILIGATIGSLIVALAATAQFTAPRLTAQLGPDSLAPTTTGLIVVLEGPRSVLAQMLATTAVGFLNASAIAVLVVLAMLGFEAIKIRSRWPALITVALIAASQSLAAPNAGLADRAALIAGNILVIGLLDRAGLLATAVAVTTVSTLSLFLVAAPYGEWWSTAALLPIAAVSALLLFGFLTATAGRSIFDN